MFNRTLALRSTTEATVIRKGILNVTDQGIKNQWATASLVQPVADTLVNGANKKRIHAVNSHNVHDTTCDH